MNEQSYELPLPFNESELGIHYCLADAIDSFETLSNWADRYRQLFKLAAKITPLDDCHRTEDNIVNGCESDVWLIHHYDAANDKHYFMADSDSKIIRGLLVLILSCYSNQNSKHLQGFDFSLCLEQLNFGKYLTPSRSNGLLSVIKKMQSTAQLKS